MSTPQTFDSTDGRMIHREGRFGQYVKLSDYEALEKELAEKKRLLDSPPAYGDVGKGLPVFSELPEEVYNRTQATD
jgi:hypothetical protein